MDLLLWSKNGWNVDLLGINNIYSHQIVPEFVSFGMTGVSLAFIDDELKKLKFDLGILLFSESGKLSILRRKKPKLLNSNYFMACDEKRLIEDQNQRIIDC